MDTKKLRQKILDLAIHGKLVPQDPNDEPASVLLERIRKEKEQLIKEGKIKAPKKSKSAGDTSHYPKDVPFEVPEGWCWVRLGDISIDMADGPFGSNLKREHYTPNREVRIIQLSNIGENGWKEENTKYTTFAHASKIERSIVTPGNLVIAKMMPAGRTIICPNNEKAYVLSSDAVKYVPSKEIYNKYLLYAINSSVVLNQIHAEVQGVTRARTSIEKLRGYYVPIPPYKEQYRIVQSIDYWLRLQESLEQANNVISESIDKAKSRILDLAIHGKLVPQKPSDEPAIELLKRINPNFKPSDNLHYGDCPEGWTIATVADVFEINPKVQGFDEVDAGFVPMTNICDGFRNKFNFEVRKWAKIKNGFTRFANGDIAVAKISPCLENRKSAIMRNLPNGIGAGTTELNIFRSRAVNPEYGLLFFKSDDFINACAGSYNGVVGQQRVSGSVPSSVSGVGSAI